VALFCLRLCCIPLLIGRCLRRAAWFVPLSDGERRHRRPGGYRGASRRAKEEAKAEGKLCISGDSGAKRRLPTSAKALGVSFVARDYRAHRPCPLLGFFIRRSKLAFHMRHPSAPRCGDVSRIGDGSLPAYLRLRKGGRMRLLATGARGASTERKATNGGGLGRGGRCCAGRRRGGGRRAGIGGGGSNIVINGNAFAWQRAVVLTACRRVSTRLRLINALAHLPARTEKAASHLPYLGSSSGARAWRGGGGVSKRSAFCSSAALVTAWRVRRRHQRWRILPLSLRRWKNCIAGEHHSGCAGMKAACAAPQKKPPRTSSLLRAKFEAAACRAWAEGEATV